MTTSVMGRPRCSPRSTSPPAPSSANAMAATVPASSAISSTRSRGNVPADLDVHLVMDNYATHKTPLIRNWLAKRPRWHVHLTPTSASWLNQVERFFALITERRIRRGIYRSVAALRADIMAFIDLHNAEPKPFRWTKSADRHPGFHRALLPLQRRRRNHDVANFRFRTLECIAAECL